MPMSRPLTGRLLPPDIKIVVYLVFVISLYLIGSLSVYLGLSAVLVILLFFIPFRKLKAGWLPISLFLVFTFFSNLVNHHGNVLLTLGSVFVTDEGLHAALRRTLRLFLMIGGLKVLMSGTPAEDLVAALGRLFMPLERVGLPVKDYVHIMGLTLHCFPVLKDMGASLYREQSALHEARGFSGRVKVVSSFMVPMFVRSVRSPGLFFDERKSDG